MHSYRRAWTPAALAKCTTMHARATAVDVTHLPVNLAPGVAFNSSFMLRKFLRNFGSTARPALPKLRKSESRMESCFLKFGPRLYYDPESSLYCAWVWVGIAGTCLPHGRGRPGRSGS